MNGTILNIVSQHPYLGITRDHKLSWHPYIETLCHKANCTLGFLKHNSTISPCIFMSVAINNSYLTNARLFRAGGSGLVCPVLAGPLIVKKKFFLFVCFCFSSQVLTFCAACTLSVMYNISFMLIVKMCQIAYLGI